jgi:inosose dehydratase
MTIHCRVAAAPCSWGVDFANDPDNPAWPRVLDEAAAAGYDAIDLGPVGYFPVDAKRLADELASRGLSLSAGGLFDPLTVETAFPKILEKTRRNCELLRALGAPRFVIIDDISKARGKTAGRSAAAVRLDREEWAKMMQRIAEIARVAREDYGVTSYLHPHAGGYIEFQDEIDRAMNDLPADLVGLCIDTGHTAYAGMDPATLIRRYASRVGHMHFKNVDPKVLADCVAEGTDFFAAVTKGVFSLLSNGAVDFLAVRSALEAIDYDGFAVVEQDIDANTAKSPVDNARANQQFLAGIGLQTKQGKSL